MGIPSRLAAVTFVLALVACSGGEDDSDDGAPETSSAGLHGEVADQQVRIVGTDGEPVLATAAGSVGEDLVVETTDGDDGSVAIRVQESDGATSVSLTFEAGSAERFFGLGERADAVDHRGLEVENRVLDGPWAPGQGEIVQAVVPEPGFEDRPDATYFPVPWVLSSRGYGVLVENDEVSRVRLATPDAPDTWTVEVDADVLELRVFGGGSPAAALGQMTAAVGRQPPAAAPFVFGPWWQADDDEVAELAALQAAGVPMSVAQTYTHYLPCGDDQGREADEQARTGRMHEAGLAVTTYVNPMVCVGYTDVYEAGVASGAFTLDPAGEPYRYHYSTATEFDVAQIDFSAEAGRSLFHDVLDLVLANGYDGWMEDFGEYTPLDAVSADGTPGPTMHNRYVEQYHQAAADFAADAPRPLARFNRSGWTDAIPASAIVWGGDPTVAWGFDGLASAVRSGLGMGLSGVSLWGSDVGGFFAFPGDELTPELLNRWIEVGAFSGVLRLQAGGISIGGGPRATVLDPDVLPVWRRYASLRTQLYPYIAGAQAAYDASGLPLMRHMVLVAPDDDKLTGLHDQFLFGADLLVAPVLEPGTTRRDLVLPEGEWIDVWRSVTFDEDGAPQLGAAVVRAAGEIAVDAPVDEVPLHAGGAVLPLLPADVDTLADHGSDAVVGLADRDDQRVLLAFPGPDWEGPLGPGESMRSSVGDHGWTLVLEASTARTYALQASLALLPDGFEPCTVTVDGDEVTFDYDAETQVLAAELEAGEEATVVVEPCS